MCRPYVHKVFFSDFDLIWCVGRPRPHMRTSVTSTRSKVKVKVKVTELPNLRKLHFSRSVSSAILAWSWKLMLGGDSMGPGLQLFGTQLLNFLLGKLAQEFKVRQMSIFHELQMAIFRSAWCYSHMVWHTDSSTCTVYVDLTLSSNPRSTWRSRSIWTSQNCP